MHYTESPYHPPPSHQARPRARHGQAAVRLSHGPGRAQGGQAGSGTGPLPSRRAGKFLAWPGKSLGPGLGQARLPILNSMPICPGTNNPMTARTSCLLMPVQYNSLGLFQSEQRIYNPLSRRSIYLRRARLAETMLTPC